MTKNQQWLCISPSYKCEVCNETKWVLLNHLIRPTFFTKEGLFSSPHKISVTNYNIDKYYCNNCGNIKEFIKNIIE